MLALRGIDWLKLIGISQYTLAKAIGVPRSKQCRTPGEIPGTGAGGRPGRAACLMPTMLEGYNMLLTWMRCLVGDAARGCKPASAKPCPMEPSCTVVAYALLMASVYIESSIISYLTAWPSRDLITASRQALTAEWWLNRKGQFEVYVSALVVEEIAGGDPSAAAQRMLAIADVPSVAITEEAQQLADALLDSKALPANSARDALHIAIAATQGTEFLLTWNFKHINNAETRAFIARVVEECGWPCPVLCSPEELGGNDHAE